MHNTNNTIYDSVTNLKEHFAAELVPNSHLITTTEMSNLSNFCRINIT